MARKKERGNGDVWMRRNGEGKIIGYRASYWVDTPNGPKRRYVSGKNKSETRAALSKADGDREDGFFSDAGTTTLGEYLDGWLDGGDLCLNPKIGALQTKLYSARRNASPTMSEVRISGCASHRRWFHWPG